MSNQQDYGLISALPSMLFPKPLTAMEGGLGVGKICSESSSSLSHLTHLVDPGSVWQDSQFYMKS